MWAEHVALVHQLLPPRLVDFLFGPRTRMIVIPVFGLDSLARDDRSSSWRRVGFLSMWDRVRAPGTVAQ
jgi:hypothetical protein